MQVTSTNSPIPPQGFTVLNLNRFRTQGKAIEGLTSTLLKDIGEGREGINRIKRHNFKEINVC